MSKSVSGVCAVKIGALLLGVLVPFGLVPLASADDDDDGPAPAPLSSNNGGPVDPDDPVIWYSDQPSVEVSYEVSGSAVSADMLYNMDGGMRRLNNSVLPWHKTVTVWPPVQFVPLFATVAANNRWDTTASGDPRHPGSKIDSGGSLTCRIRVNGKVVQERTASGARRTAKCAVTVRFFV